MSLLQHMAADHCVGYGNGEKVDVLTHAVRTFDPAIVDRALELNCPMDEHAIKWSVLDLIKAPIADAERAQVLSAIGRAFLAKHGCRAKLVHPEEMIVWPHEAGVLEEFEARGWHQSQKILQTYFDVRDSSPTTCGEVTRA